MWRVFSFADPEVINAQLLPEVVKLMGGAEFDIKKEAAWCISNATSGGSPEQIGSCGEPLRRPWLRLRVVWRARGRMSECGHKS